MRSVVRCVLVVMVVGVLAALGPVAGQQRPLVITGGHLFTAVGDRRIPNRGVLVRAGKFLIVDGVIEPALLEHAEQLHLGDDETLIPGLFDLHAHYAMDLFDQGRVDVTAHLPALFLANGVTSTFPAGEVDPEDMDALRLRLDRGEQVGPRLFTSGPYFGRWRKGWDRDIAAEDLRAEVDHWAARGVTGFKAKNLSAAHLAVLIERAHQHGLTVTGHLGSGQRDTVNPRDAIAMGIDRVEHFLGGDAFLPDRSAYASLVEVETDTPEFRRICRQFIEHGVFFDATLSAYGYFGEQDPEVFTPWVDEQSFFTPFVRERYAARPAREPMARFETIYWLKRETLKAFYAAGGGHLITVGTDHASWGQYLAPFGVHRELHCFVLAGLPTAAALRAATINAARALGLGDRLGSLEVGKWADAVVLRGDPLDDIRVTRQPRLVLRGGQVHDPALLLEAARGTIGPRAEGAVGDW